MEMTTRRKEKPLRSMNTRIVSLGLPAPVARDYPLLEYYKTEEYLRHNPYIIHGYRSNLNFWQTLKSLVHVHNGMFWETSCSIYRSTL